MFKVIRASEGTVRRIADNKTATDTCFIGKDTPYEMRGTFNAIVVNQPAFGSKM